MIKQSALRTAIVVITMAACSHINQQPDYPLKESTAWVADSLEWVREAETVFAEATAYIDSVAETMPRGSWGVVLDVDETVLNNVEYQIGLDRSQSMYTEESWYEWTQEEKATLVPGAKAFIQRVNGLGGHVALVTNRTDLEQFATEANLSKLGIERHHQFRVLLTRSQPNGSSDKNIRFELVPRILAAQGFENVDITAYIGDGKGDKPSSAGNWQFFCIDQGAMYGEYCAEVPGSGN
ncbi:MAG: HAD family acid phosphatase [Pseudomonadota bacterium]